MKLLLLISIALLSRQGLASPEYMNESRVATALQAEFGPLAGVNTSSCTLCHATSSGGSTNFNSFGFGRDFIDAAARLGITPASELPATGAINSVQAVFAESSFRQQDSDGDGTSNQDEYAANTDPSISSGSASVGNDGASASCGMIDPRNKKGQSPGTSLFLVLLMPLIIVVGRPLAQQLKRFQASGLY